MMPAIDRLHAGARTPERRRPRVVSPLRRPRLSGHGLLFVLLLLLLAGAASPAVRAAERPADLPDLPPETLVRRVADLDRHHRTRDAYARELLRRPDEALGALVAALGAEDLAARRTAAFLLGQLADPRAEAALLRLAGEEDFAAPAARDALAAISARLSPEERLRRLHGFAPATVGGTDSSAERAMIRAALASLLADGEADAPPTPPPAPELRARLETLLGGDSPAIRAAAARVLGRFGAGGPLLARLEAEEDPAVLEAILQAMLSAPPPGGDEAVLLLTEHTNARVVLAAARVLHAYGYDGAVEAMALGLKSSSVAVRLRAAEILGAIGSEAALDALAGALADPEWMVRRAAVRALGEIPSPRVPGLLTPLQEDPDPRVRAPALRVLAGRGVGGALWALAEELAGPTAAKLVALDALRALADPSVVPEVGRTASDPDLEVAARAVETLAVTESGPALAHLFRALYDPRLGVSSVARAGLLRRTGSDPGARPGAWRRWGEARGLAPPD